MNLNFEAAKRLGSEAYSAVKILLVRFDKALKFIALYLAVAGVFGFSCFMMEESIQLLSFANFSASDTRQYQLLKENLDAMERINSSLKWMNKYCLWIVPPQWLGYRHYASSTDLYIQTLRAEVLANEPACFLGEQVSVHFRHNGYEKKHNDLWVAKRRGVKLILSSPPGAPVISVVGLVKPDPDAPGGVIIEQVTAKGARGGG